MDTDRIRELEEQIVQIKKRIPPHSAPPYMFEEIERLEDQLEIAKRESDAQENGGSGL